MLKYFEFGKQYKTQLREILTKKPEGHFKDQIENNKQNPARVIELKNQLEKAGRRVRAGRNYQRTV